MLETEIQIEGAVNILRFNSLRISSERNVFMELYCSGYFDNTKLCEGALCNVKSSLMSLLVMLSSVMYQMLITPSRTYLTEPPMAEIPHQHGQQSFTTPGCGNAVTSALRLHVALNFSTALKSFNHLADRKFHTSEKSDLTWPTELHHVGLNKHSQ